MDKIGDGILNMNTPVRKYLKRRFGKRKSTCNPEQEIPRHLILCSWNDCVESIGPLGVRGWSTGLSSSQV